MVTFVQSAHSKNPPFVKSEFSKAVVFAAITSVKWSSELDALMKLEGMPRNWTCSRRRVIVSKETQLILQLATSRMRMFVRFAFLRESYVSCPNLKSAPGFSPEKPITEISVIIIDDLVAFTSESYPSHLKLVNLQSVKISVASNKFKNPPVKLVNLQFIMFTGLFSAYARLIRYR
jgi:hypothetical protein